MIALTDVSKNIVDLIRAELGETDWRLFSDLGELTDEKDKIAYFAISSNNDLIYNNLTMECSCELVATVLFEERTNEEIREEINNLSEAFYEVINNLAKYEELECSAIYLGHQMDVPSTSTDDLYFSFVQPITLYIQL